MLSRDLLRNAADRVRDLVASRGYDPDLVDRWSGLDAGRRSALVELERLKQQRNESSRKIGEIKREGGDAAAAIEEVGLLKGRIGALEERLAGIESELGEVELDLPNLPHDSVPLGDDESSNREERRVGEPPEFDFEPKAHWDLGPELGILDFERGAKLTGARFTVYWDAGARLERALINFMLDLHTSQHGYREVLPPFIVNADSLTGTGQLPKFGEDLFRLEGDDAFYLVPTAEVPLTNLHRGEILDEAELPLRYTAFTPCFRSEAGSYGKDVRGLIRQHQFNKVELVHFAAPDKSYEALEELTGHAETVLRLLELPYRVVTLSTGDMGISAAKTYDLEVWLPGQQAYREISSCSNCEAYQARRAGVRCRAEGGKPRHVHTLNGSGLAVGRTVVAILENHQREDGSVAIPEALWPYMGGAERIG